LANYFHLSTYEYTLFYWVFDMTPTFLDIFGSKNVILIYTWKGNIYVKVYSLEAISATMIYSRTTFVISIRNSKTCVPVTLIYILYTTRDALQFLRLLSMGSMYKLLCMIPHTYFIFRTLRQFDKLHRNLNCWQYCFCFWLYIFKKSTNYTSWVRFNKTTINIILLLFLIFTTINNCIRHIKWYNRWNKKIIYEKGEKFLVFGLWVWKAFKMPILFHILNFTLYCVNFFF